jgi:signal peptidase I
MPDSVQPRDQFKHSLATEILRSSGTLRLSAFGNSMLPTFWPGDRLTIRQRSIEQVLPGDVVLFTREGRFFIHRVLRKIELDSHLQLLTRGDAMPDADAPVVTEELLGKIVSIETQRGRQLPVPRCSGARRWMGLALAYSARLRSLALRWRARGAGARSGEAVPEQVSLG